ncbi:hypothetical protein DSCO28_59440 [Desulfosarcina ovata subsp. sediminis]|uniref:Uncharacterized protein n=2 Tax=Desulfosarcina ovata TaxID=83564 RepID=A0A5K8AI16_9BACT|nr:hypothetical protein DSCO28_59440 [Desulfosarcina ovata subsp. sediminis]BBO92281.1 hypothetical protein DSCOOX_54610 [Desulfosarcina ovata subsp. ovata]
MNPAYARLVGPAGSHISKSITITREKAYPFRIVEAKARNGKDIAFALKELKATEGDGYLLTIENKKTAAGRYADTVILTTDSTIKPTISVPIYGQIKAAAPPAANPDPSKPQSSGS